MPTLEFSIYSSEAQGKCAMFVDFSLYVDHDRNLRVLIFSLLGRGFAWLISLSILAKFVVVVAVPWVIRRGSEGQGGWCLGMCWRCHRPRRVGLSLGCSLPAGRTEPPRGGGPEGGSASSEALPTQRGSSWGSALSEQEAWGMPGAGQGKGAGWPLPPSPLPGSSAGAAALLPLLLSPLASSSR